MIFVDRAAVLDALTDLYEGALDHHWQVADYLAEALGWDLDEHLGRPPLSEWIRTKLDEALR